VDGEQLHPCSRLRLLLLTLGRIGLGQVEVGWVVLRRVQQQLASEQQLSRQTSLGEQLQGLW